VEASAGIGRHGQATASYSLESRSVKNGEIFHYSTGSPGGQTRRSVGTGRSRCGAVPGPTIQTGHVLRTATGTTPTTGTTTTGFGAVGRPRLIPTGRKQPQAHGSAAGAQEGEDDRGPFPATTTHWGWNGQIENSPTRCGKRAWRMLPDLGRRSGWGSEHGPDRSSKTCQV